MSSLGNASRAYSFAAQTRTPNYRENPEPSHSQRHLFRKGFDSVAVVVGH